jgi:glutathione S-transferase
MDPITIYGDRKSGNCLKVLWTAEQTGVPHTFVEVDVLGGGARTPQMLKLNPAGQVPVIVLSDGRTLSQSNAIMLHLAETTGSSLLPTDAYDRACVYQWLFWEQYSHETAIAVRRFRKAYQQLPDEEIDPSLMTRGLAALELMDRTLGGHTWIGGTDGMSLADIALVAYTRVAPEGGFDLSPFTDLRSWIARVERTLGLPVSEC